MASLARIETYFSSVAGGYQRASTSALWRKVRDREAEAVVRLLGDVRDHDVVDLGSGAGFYTRLLLEQGARHVVAIDLSQAMLDQLPDTGVTPVLGDGATVALERRYETIVSAGMLEFVPDAEAALRNAARMAEPKARMVVLYPTLSLLGRAYRRFHRRNGLSITLFSPADIARLATCTGWRIEASSAAGPYSACTRLERDVSH
jgi:ubiquinone/menaquinone biosynthesis C-methylase UbiE